MKASKLQSRIQRQKQFEPATPGLDVSSLIDVSFLLLVFFLATSSLQKKETDLSMNLPREEISPQNEEIYPMEIELHADGSISVDEEIVSQDTTNREMPQFDKKLDHLLKLLRSTDQVPVAFVTADDNATHQRLVDIVNTLAKFKITNVAMNGFRD
ncbi:MAG: biopolymer transporter ExbD [Verrucomicrobiota bacterium]